MPQEENWALHMSPAPKVLGKYFERRDSLLREGTEWFSWLKFRKKMGVGHLPVEPSSVSSSVKEGDAPPTPSTPSQGVARIK